MPTPILRYVSAAVIVLALAGCSTQTTTTAATAPAKTASAKPSPTPTPTAMSMQEAASVYKAGACAVNITGKTFNDVWQGNSGDIAALQAAAVAARDASSATATKYDKARWPDDLQADVNLVRDADFAAASTLSQIASSATWEAAVQNSFADNPAASAASQRLRSRLGLPADPFAC